MNRRDALLGAVCALTCGRRAEGGEKVDSLSGDQMTKTLYVAKSRLGRVKPGVELVVVGQANKLILGGQRWTGKTRGDRQLVIVWRNGVVDSHSIDRSFTLAEVTLISFEEDRILFVDIETGKNGYYNRRSEE